MFICDYCCIDYDVITDCNGQASVLVSTIKMQVSFCSHGQTCVFCVTGCAYVAYCVCLGVCVYTDSLG